RRCCLPYRTIAPLLVRGHQRGATTRRLPRRRAAWRLRATWNGGPLTDPTFSVAPRGADGGAPGFSARSGRLHPPQRSPRGSDSHNLAMEERPFVDKVEA